MQDATPNNATGTTTGRSPSMRPRECAHLRRRRRALRERQDLGVGRHRDESHPLSVRSRRPVTAYSCSTSSDPSLSPTVSRNIAHKEAPLPSSSDTTSTSRRLRMQSAASGGIACHESGSATSQVGRLGAVLERDAAARPDAVHRHAAGTPSRAHVGHAPENARGRELAGIAGEAARQVAATRNPR